MKAIADFLLAIIWVAGIIATWLLAPFIGGILLTGGAIFVIYAILREQSRD